MALQQSTPIETATIADEDKIIDTLMLAFGSDPLMRWFFPSTIEFTTHFRTFVQLYGGKAFDNETAYYLDEFAAAALWLPPGVTPDDDEMAAFFQESLSEQRLERAVSIVTRLDELHPAEPYWHLPAIGTEPTQQRNGYGSALMSHVLELCDEQGTQAYLESSNPLNISLYVRHGFEILDVIQEGSMPPLIPMVRYPQD